MNTKDCVCDTTVPVCPDCGRKWTHYSTDRDGKRRYTSSDVVSKYLALYGQPKHIQFHEIA